MILKVLIIVSFLFGFTRANVRIVGGEKADIKDYPYQISLLYGGLHICGGTIIGPHTIVTAAHCTDGHKSKHLSIRYGSSIINKGGNVVNVKEIHQHPKYNESPTDYDVSVLILKSAVKEASNRMVKLANATLDINTKCIVTGWGSSSENGSTLPYLQKVELPILALNYCNYTYLGYVTKRFICAGYPAGGQDACQGDSGGPLVVNKTLHGIVSYGNGCARPRFPGLYTSVLDVRDFIIANSKSSRNYFQFRYANVMFINILIKLII